MEGCCLDRFIKKVNVSSVYDNGGGDVHQPNDTVQEFYIKQIEQLAYHRIYYKIIGEYHVDYVRHKMFESTPVDISTQYDYAEQFGFDPDGQIQNEFFDNNCCLSMESCFLDRFKKQGNVSSFYDNCGGDVHQFNYTIREFHLHLSD